MEANAKGGSKIGLQPETNLKIRVIELFRDGTGGYGTGFSRPFKKKPEVGSPE